MSDYPEHDKLKKVKTQSQACGEFLEWLMHEKKFRFSRIHEHTDDCYSVNVKGTVSRHIRICDFSTGITLETVVINRDELLAEFFKIDTKKLQDEKDKMLAEHKGGRR